MNTLTVLLVWISFGLLAAGIYWLMQTLRLRDKGMVAAKRSIAFMASALAIFVVASLTFSDQKGDEVEKVSAQIAAVEPKADPLDEPKDTPAQRGNLRYIKSDEWLGCTDIPTYERLIELAGQGDGEAVGKAVLEAFASELCRPFTAGEPVYVDDMQFPGLVKLRPQGEVNGWWTAVEASTSIAPGVVSTGTESAETAPSEDFAPNGITPLSFVETMGRDPEYLEMGQECSAYETGTMCQWGETDYFKSATVTHRSFEHYTVLLIDPKFPTEGLENDTLTAPEASGALEGGHSKLTVTNNGERQLFIQSSAAYAAQ